LGSGGSTGGSSGPGGITGGSPGEGGFTGGLPGPGGFTGGSGRGTAPKSPAFDNHGFGYVSFRAFIGTVSLAANALTIAYRRRRRIAIFQCRACAAAATAAIPISRPRMDESTGVTPCIPNPPDLQRVFQVSVDTPRAIGPALRFLNAIGYTRARTDGHVERLSGALPGSATSAVSDSRSRVGAAILFPLPGAAMAGWLPGRRFGGKRSWLPA
jgi:hypothetical protein